MRSPIYVLLALTCLPAFTQTAPLQLTAPSPNWGIPTYVDEYPLPVGLTPALIAQPGLLPGGTCPAQANGITFTFAVSATQTIPATPAHAATAGAISTSAVVYDTTLNQMAATLWSNVTLASNTLSNPTYCGIWNGYLDSYQGGSGSSVTTGTPGVATLAPATDTYEVKVLYNNVQYTWDGPIGSGNEVLSGPANWDAQGPFPSGMTFIWPPSKTYPSSDFGVFSNGYNEGTPNASIIRSYQESGGVTDFNTVWPLNFSLYALGSTYGSGEFDFTATDGNNLYFAANGIGSGRYSGVVGVTPVTATPTLPIVGHSLYPSTFVDPGTGCPTGTSSSSTYNNQTLCVDTLDHVGYGPPTTQQGLWGTDPSSLFASGQSLGPTHSSSYSYFENDAIGTFFDPTESEPDNGVAVSVVSNQTVTGIVPTGVSETSKNVTLALPGTPMTGLAVQPSTVSAGLLAVAEGAYNPLHCGDMTSTGGTTGGTRWTPQIVFYNRTSGALVGSWTTLTDPATSAAINPQKMAFDTAGNLWVIDGGVPAVDCADPANPRQGNLSGSNADPIWKSYGHLLELTFTGTPSNSNPPTITVVSSIGGVTLSNPVDVTVSQAVVGGGNYGPGADYGYIFVADGGVNQQVFEFNPTTLSGGSATITGVAVGAAGGYQYTSATSNTCNANLTSSGTNKLWLDYVGLGTGATRPWIAVDHEDRLWIGDASTGRVLLYAKDTNGNYAYVDEVEHSRYLYTMAIPRNATDRLFAGTTGLLEYHVEYPDPDPAPAQANNYMVRNWLPCFLQAEWQNGGYADTSVMLGSVEAFDGGTFGFASYHSNSQLMAYPASPNVLLNLPTSGTLTAQNNTGSKLSGITLSGNKAYFDSDGAFYQKNIASTPTNVCAGSSTCASGPIYRYTPTLGGSGWPTWGSPTTIATVTLNLWNGDSEVGSGADGFDPTPTTSGVIPIFGGDGWNWGKISTSCNARTSSNCYLAWPVYHLGGLLSSGTTVKTPQWHAQLETPVEYPMEVNDTLPITSYPPNNAKKNNLGFFSDWETDAGWQSNTAIAVHAIDNFIFGGYNGNWQQFSCQFYQYTDDGMLIGQFGWRGTGLYFNNGTTPKGEGSPLKGEALSPGFCGNVLEFKMVKVNSDYYLYSTDEGYRGGIQRWHISNTSSIQSLQNSAAIGATGVALH